MPTVEWSLDRLWASGSAGARVGRALLAPPSWVFAVAVRLRNLGYDHGWLPSHALDLPAISVGNLSVGGTGKTPLAAWVATELHRHGARPAIVLRGYGRDEPLVHARLNPSIPVVIDANRVRGVARARAEGATVAVLDDAFQHRRARRDADIVLLSADRFGPVRLLPAGPWREPLASLSRATAIVVTRKAASPLRARELLVQVQRFARRAAGAIVHLEAAQVVAWETGASAAAATLSGTDVLAVSAIGEPRAFETQLRAQGARVATLAFRDHHHFSVADVRSIVARSARARRVVCTLKDAVKLGPLWPREAPPLWYLSQHVAVETGAEALDGLIAGFAFRGSSDGSITPAKAGPTTDPNVS